MLGQRRGSEIDVHDYALNPLGSRGEARGLKVVCLEAFHARDVTEVQRNKTDKNDARGLANPVRTGWFRSVHIKSDASYRLRFLLGLRDTMVRKRVELEKLDPAVTQGLRPAHGGAMWPIFRMQPGPESGSLRCKRATE